MDNAQSRQVIYKTALILSITAGIIHGIFSALAEPAGLLASVAATAVLVTGYLFMSGIYVVAARLLGGGSSVSGLLNGLLWYLGAFWVLGELSQFFFSAFRILRRLDVFTPQWEVTIACFAVLTIFLAVYALYRFSSRPTGAFPSGFGGLVISVAFVYLFCRYNFPLSLKSVTATSVAVNLSLLVVFLALMLTVPVRLRGVGQRLDQRLGKIISRISSPLLYAIVFVSLAGTALSAYGIAQRDYSLEEEQAGRSGMVVADSQVPNVVILLADALRADCLGVYGAGKDVSPFIDSLCEQSVVFTHHHSETSWTKPSVASLFTGLHQSEHGLLFSDYILDRKYDTLSEDFSRLGYRTGAFISNIYLVRPNGFSQGFSHYDTGLLKSPGWVRQLAESMPGFSSLLEYRKLVESKNIKPRAEDLNERFVDWASTQGGPFFAYLHYMEPHAPYDPPEPFKQGAESVRELSSMGSIVDVDRRLYRGEVTYWDHCLKDLFGELESRGLTRNTIFVLTADHGEEFLEHGGLNHNRTLYEEVVWVPLIIHYPGRFGTRRLIGWPTHANDLGYTLLKMAGGEKFTPAVNGACLLDSSYAAKPPLVMEHYREDRILMAGLEGYGKSIISRNADGNTSMEYYDLAADPLEKNPQTEPGEQGAALAEYLGGHMAAAAKRQAGGEKAEMPKHVVEKLKTLGYIK